MIYKIGFFIPEMNGGGAEKVYVNLINWLKLKNNIDICLIVNKKRGPNLKLIDSKVEILELNSKKILFSFFKLQKEIKKNNIKFLVSTIRGANIAVAISRIFYRNYRWILREANTFTNLDYKESLYKNIFNFLCKSSYRFSDGIIANSPDTKQDIINKLWKINREKVRVIPNPVVDSVSYSNKIFNRATPQKIIAVGRLTYQKDFSFLLNIFSNVLKTNSDVVLEICGEGPEFSKLKKLAHKLDITDKVVFSGYVTDVVMRIEKSDLFILTSRWEGFGNVLVESMNVGTPIVSVNCPGGPNYILKEHDLISISHMRTVDSMSSLVIEMLNKHKTVEQINSLKKFSEQYTISKIGHDYLDVILDKNNL